MNSGECTLARPPARQLRLGCMGCMGCMRYMGWVVDYKVLVLEDAIDYSSLAIHTPLVREGGGAEIRGKCDWK